MNEHINFLALASGGLSLIFYFSLDFRLSLLYEFEMAYFYVMIIGFCLSLLSFFTVVFLSSYKPDTKFFSIAQKLNVNLLFIPSVILFLAGFSYKTSYFIGELWIITCVTAGVWFLISVCHIASQLCGLQRKEGEDYNTLEEVYDHNQN